jgi:hypothetical protein
MNITKSQLQRLIKEELGRTINEQVDHPSLWLRSAAGYIAKVVRVQDHPNLTEEDRARLDELHEEIIALAEKVAGWGP